MAMRSDFYELIDLDKLKKSNDLCLKWTKRLNVTINNRMKTAIHIQKNPDIYIKKLDINYRSQFRKDLKEMFYASEVEGLIIEQFATCVKYIMGKMKIPDHLKEEYESLGLIAIRSSAWNFRTHAANVKLFTFIYNGVFHRLIGFRNKERKKQQRRKATCFNESDILSSCEQGFQMNYLIDKPININANIEKEEYDNTVKSLFVKTDLKEDEIFLIEHYMRRNIDCSNWNNLYRNKFLSKNEKKVTKEGVFVKLRIIQRKLWKTYANLKKIPVFNIENKFAI